MPTPITEVVVLSFQPGSSFTEPLEGLFKILSRQPGFKSAHYGKWVDNPNKVQLLIEWDDISFHQAFEKSGEDFAAVGALLGPILTAPPSMHHVHFSPPLESSLSFSPESILEVVIFSSPDPTFEENLESLLASFGKVGGFRGASKGKVVEIDAYQLHIQWESVLAYDRVKEIEDLNANLDVLCKSTEKERWFARF